MEELAIVTEDTRVVRMRFDGTEWREAQPDHAQSLWPTSRPGASEWTFSIVTPEASALVTAGDGQQEEVPESRTEPPVLMGPRLPHYALWSDDGRRLCYVVPDGRSLSLKVSGGDTSIRTLLSGAPVFPVWLGTSGWLMCHHGATLSAYDLESGEQRVLSNSASGFRTPACASDGSFVAWAEVRDGSVHVMTSQLGSEALELGRFGGGVSLAFRPGSRQLFAAVAESPETGVFGELLTLDLAGGKVRRILRGPLVAWWWDPAGERIASLHPTYSGDGRFQVRIHSADGAFLAATEGFIPSNDCATAVSFFDQYALSHPPFSSDGRWFGLSGKFPKDGPHPSFSGGVGDSAWVWDTSVRGPVIELLKGQMLAFARDRGK